MMKSRSVFVLLLSLSIVAAMLTGCAVFNPLRRPQSSVRKWILSQTPLGTSMQQVRETIAQRGWQVGSDREDCGFYDQRTRPAKSTGEKHIRASLGDYQGFPWEVNVTVFWGFDAELKLIDIWVWKTADAL